MDNSEMKGENSAGNSCVGSNGGSNCVSTNEISDADFIMLVINSNLLAEKPNDNNNV